MGLNINFEDVKESGFGLLPKGEYSIIVDDAVIKETKDGTGSYINMKLKLIGGNYDGRFLFTMFNIKNKNPEATAIGLSQLKTFCKVSGRGDKPLTDVTQLVGFKAVAVVKTKEDSYGEKNVVSYFKPYKKENDSLTSKTTKNENEQLPF